MSVRYLSLVALVSLVGIAACDDDDITGVGTNATVRFVNATNSNIDVVNNGVVGTGNGNLSFGASSSCMAVSTSNPSLAFRTTGTTTPLTFAPSFAPGGNYVVIATTGATGTQFTTVPVDFSATSGQAGLVAVNAANATQGYDLYVTAPGGALTTATAANLGFGTPSAFFSVNSGAQQLRYTTTGTTTVALNAGNTTFNAGTNSVVVLGPPANASTTLRSFVVAGC